MHFETLSPDEAASTFRDLLLHGIDQFIPQRMISLQSSSHSWVNQRCLDLVRSKDTAFGTRAFKTASENCSRGLLMEYQSFLTRQSSKLKELPRGRKRWWRLTDAILGKPTKTSSFPSIKDNNEEILDAKTKCDTFANFFISKWITSLRMFVYIQAKQNNIKAK